MPDFEYQKQCSVKASWRYEVITKIPCTEEEKEIYGVDYKKSNNRTHINLDEIHVKDTNSSIYQIHYFRTYSRDIAEICDPINLYFSTFESAEKHIFEEYPDAKFTRNWEVPDK